MVINDNDFFREATLRICGSLEIEKALGSFFEFLQSQLPVDIVILQRFDANHGAMRTIAIADETGHHSSDTLTPLSEEARNLDPDKITKAHDVYLFTSPFECQLCREMLEFHQNTCTSLMVMTLQSDEQVIGHLVCISAGEELYAEEHARLISLLKEPL